MSSFLMAASVVIPLLIYMVVGHLIRRFGILSRDNIRALNRMIFLVLIPLSLFFEIYQADLKEVFDPVFFCFVIVAIFIAFILLRMISFRLIKDRADAATIAQSMYRSNYVLFGQTIADSAGGPASIALTSALSSVVVPLYNVLAVILFETTRRGKIKPGTLLFNILKNPLVTGGIIGVIFNVLKIPIPTLVATPLHTLGKAATPIALVCLGGLLTSSSLKKHLRYVAPATVVRLVALPLIVIVIAIAAGYRGDHLIVLLAIFGSPTAVASQPMAQVMGGNGDLAGEMVAVTTAASILTIFVFVVVLFGTGLC